jgi:hypothetical protein
MEPAYNRTPPLYPIMRQIIPVHNFISKFLRSTLIIHYYPPSRDFPLTPLGNMTVILYLLSLVTQTFHSLVKLDNTL